jgi:hypothetical protein
VAKLIMKNGLGQIEAFARTSPLTLVYLICLSGKAEVIGVLSEQRNYPSPVIDGQFCRDAPC